MISEIISQMISEMISEMIAEMITSKRPGDDKLAPRAEAR